MQVLRVNLKANDAPEQFFTSIKNSGFAVIYNHEIDLTLIQKNYQSWQEFFESEDKFNYALDNDTQTGYVPYRSEHSIFEQNLKNLSEFFNYYEGANIPKNLMESTQAMYQALCLTGKKLLHFLDETLPETITQSFSMPMAKMIEHSNRHLLRLIHYPALQGTQLPGEIRTTRHEDSDLITLLPCPTGPGLQIETQKGQWQTVAYHASDIVINIGAILERITYGYLKSTFHRVINPDDAAIENCARMSMPLFMHPRDDVLIDENLTAGEFLHEYLVKNGVKQ